MLVKSFKLCKALSDGCQRLIYKRVKDNCFKQLLWICWGFVSGLIIKLPLFLSLRLLLLNSFNFQAFNVSSLQFYISLAVATAPAYPVSRYSFKNVWHFPRRCVTVHKSLLAFCMVLLTKFTWNNISCKTTRETMKSKDVKLFSNDLASDVTFGSRSSSCIACSASQTSTIWYLTAFKLLILHSHLVSETSLTVRVNWLALCIFHLLVDEENRTYRRCKTPNKETFFTDEATASPITRLSKWHPQGLKKALGTLTKFLTALLHIFQSCCLHYRNLAPYNFSFLTHRLSLIHI